MSGKRALVLDRWDESFAVISAAYEASPTKGWEKEADPIALRHAFMYGARAAAVDFEVQSAAQYLAAVDAAYEAAEDREVKREGG